MRKSVNFQIKAKALTKEQANKKTVKTLKKTAQFSLRKYAIKA